MHSKGMRRTWTVPGLHYSVQLLAGRWRVALRSTICSRDTRCTSSISETHKPEKSNSRVHSLVKKTRKNSTAHRHIMTYRDQFSANDENSSKGYMRKAWAVGPWLQEHPAVCLKSPEDADGSGEPAFGGDFPLPHRSYRVGCL